MFAMPNHLAQLFSEDSRYPPEAYAFVIAALQHTQESLERTKLPELDQRHVSAVELLEGLRDFALKQFGRLTLPVLHPGGITSTSDVGDIVYNLIEYQQMSKTDSDSRTEFDNIFDFEEVFQNDFQIKCTNKNW